MTATGDALNQVIPALVRLARRPGAALLTLATVTVGAFALLGLVHGTSGTAWTDWLPLMLAGILAVPVVVLAVRRLRLQAQTAGLDRGPTISGKPGAIARRDEAGNDPWAQEAETISAAMAENALRTARFLPGVEAAQRAARLAAGGTVNAPYLKDDIRVTLVALIATLVAVPLGSLGAIVTAIALLAR